MRRLESSGILEHETKSYESRERTKVYYSRAQQSSRKQHHRLYYGKLANPTQKVLRVFTPIILQ